MGAILEFTPDLIVDIPKLWEILATILAPALIEVKMVQADRREGIEGWMDGWMDRWKMDRWIDG